MSEAWGVDARARALHERALVCDLIVNWEPELDVAMRRGVLPRYRAAGIDYVSLTLVDDWSSVEAMVRHIAAERHFFLSHPDDYVLVESVADIRRAKAAGKLAGGVNFQGSSGLGGDVHLVEAYYRLGVRQMILAYNIRNLAADGCHEASDSGLSQYGSDLVTEMNRVGMLVDVSHMGHRSSLDEIAVSSALVIFSHSNARALRDHPRRPDSGVCRRLAG